MPSDTLPYPLPLWERVDASAASGRVRGSKSARPLTRLAAKTPRGTLSHKGRG
jgi:hypothetical protein